MRLALSEAKLAAAHGDVPVGAVVTVGGRVVARGHNRRVIDADPLAHAEVVAVRNAAAALDNWRLDDATLFVTLEPCVMCAGTLVQTRVGRLVYGATDTKAGAVRSLYQLCDDPRSTHRLAVTSGVLADEAAELLTTFFRQHRGS